MRSEALKYPFCTRDQGHKVKNPSPQGVHIQDQIKSSGFQTILRVCVAKEMLSSSLLVALSMHLSRVTELTSLCWQPGPGYLSACFVANPHCLFVLMVCGRGSSRKRRWSHWLFSRDTAPKCQGPAPSCIYITHPSCMCRHVVIHTCMYMYK